MFILSLVCLFSTFGGILLAQSLKGMLIFKMGLERGQKLMFTIGIASVILALLLSALSSCLAGSMGSCHKACPPGQGMESCPRHN